MRWASSRSHSSPLRHGSFPSGSPFGFYVLLPIRSIGLAAPSVGAMPHPRHDQRQRDALAPLVTTSTQRPSTGVGPRLKNPTRRATAALQLELDVARRRPSEAATSTRRSIIGLGLGQHSPATNDWLILRKSAARRRRHWSLLSTTEAASGEKALITTLPNLPLGCVSTVSRIQLRCRMLLGARQPFCKAPGRRSRPRVKTYRRRH